MSEKNNNWVELPTAPNGAKREMPVVPEDARAIGPAQKGASSLPTHLMAPAAMADDQLEPFAAAATSTDTMDTDSTDTDSWTATTIPEGQNDDAWTAPVAHASTGSTPEAPAPFEAPPASVPAAEHVPEAPAPFEAPEVDADVVAGSAWEAPVAFEAPAVPTDTSDVLADTEEGVGWTAPVAATGAAVAATAAVSSFGADDVAPDVDKWVPPTADIDTPEMPSTADLPDLPSTDVAGGGWTPPTAEVDMPDAKVDADFDHNIDQDIDTPSLDAPAPDSPAVGADTAVPLVAADTNFGGATTASDFADGATKTDADNVEAITAFSPVEQEVPEADARFKKIAAGLLGIAALALIAFGAYWFLNKDNDANDGGVAVTDPVVDNETGDEQPVALPNDDQNVTEPEPEVVEPEINTDENGLPVGPPAGDVDAGDDFELELVLPQEPGLDEVAENGNIEITAVNDGSGFRLGTTDADGNAVTESITEVCLNFGSAVTGEHCVDTTSPVETTAFTNSGQIAVGGVVDGSVARVEMVFSDGQRAEVPLTPVFGDSARWFFNVTIDPASGVDPVAVELLGPNGDVVETVDNLDSLPAA